MLLKKNTWQNKHAGFSVSVHAGTGLPSNRNNKKFIVISLFFVLSAATVLRFAPLRRLTIDDQPVLLGYDPYYHLRRADLIANGTGLPPVDYYSAYPQGGKAHWSPIFDGILAASIVAGRWFHIGAERAVSIVPLILGLINIAVLGLFFGRSESGAPFLLAVSMVAILPAHIRPSSFGFPDHHVLEILLTTVTFAFLSRLPDRKYAVLSGILLGLCQLSWRGAVLITAIAGGAVTITFFIQKYRENNKKTESPDIESERFLSSASTTFLTAFLTYCMGIPIGIVHLSTASIFEFSRIYALILLSVFLLLWLLKGMVTHKRIPFRIAFFLGMALVPLVFFELTGDSFREGLTFLMGHHRWRETISESRSILVFPGIPPFSLITELFGGWIYVAPLIFVFWIYRRVKEKPSVRDIIISVWFVVFLVVMLKQQRYAHQVAVPFALMCGLALKNLMSVVNRWHSTIRVIAVVIAVLAWSPVLVYHYYLLTTGINLWRRIPESYFRTCRWMAEHLPRSGDFRNPGVPPTYGIMNTWETGHWITWLAHRAPVANNFGAEPGGHSRGLENACRFYTLTDAKTAAGALERLNARFVVTDRYDGNLPDYGYIAGLDRKTVLENLTDLVVVRLYLVNGSDSAYGIRHKRILHGVDGFRLVYQSPVSDPGKASEVKVFEHVPGARIVLLPDAVPPVTLQVEVRTNDHRMFQYFRQWHEKISEIRLPYASIDCPYACRAASPARVTWNGGFALYSASEKDVQEGALLTPIQMKASGFVEETDEQTAENVQ